MSRTRLRVGGPILAAAVLIALAPGAPALAFDPVVPGSGSLNGLLPERGHGELTATYANQDFEEFWVGTTKVTDPGVGTVDFDVLSFGLEWGLADNLGLAVNAAYVDASSTGLGRFEDAGLQDLTALLEYRFFSSGPHSLLAGAGVRAPLGDYEGNLPVVLGDHTTDGLLRFVYAFHSGGFDFSQQVGFDFRGGDAPDGYPLYTELRYTTGRLTFIGSYSNLIVNDGTDIGEPGFTFPSLTEEHSRVEIGLAAQVASRLDVGASYFTTLDGRNAGEIDGFTVGASMSF